MQSRMKNPATSLPGAFEALQALHKSTETGDVPRATLELMNLRASQINGCSVCVDMHWRALRKLGEKDARIFAVSAWREAPYYSDAERAALDRSQPVRGPAIGCCGDPRIEGRGVRDRLLGELERPRLDLPRVLGAERGAREIPLVDEEERLAAGLAA